jgi:RimJ/RimL family protein N-acetyltransferase
MAAIPIVTTPRLRLEPFAEADIPGLAAILAEPEVTKNITANGSTPERCRASAAARIARHNTGWAARGYGVWAVRAGEGAGVPVGELVGWCGFAPPDIGDDPEILYGYDPRCWGRGLAKEAALAAIDWLFDATGEGGVSAVIFTRLAPASVALVGKLGMTKRGTMSMADFLPDLDLARDVLDYEIWRLGHGRSADPEALLFQAPHKGGQLATLPLGDDAAAVEQAFCAAARRRPDCAAIDRAVLDSRVRAAFRQGMAEPWLDWYHLPRAD